MIINLAFRVCDSQGSNLLAQLQRLAIIIHGNLDIAILDKFTNKNDADSIKWMDTGAL